ncbi:MAG: transposase [bacterium]|nr:transposase [bacterium]
MYASYDGSAGGQPPYDPQMMVSLLLYAYCVGIVSSRKVDGLAKSPSMRPARGAQINDSNRKSMTSCAWEGRPDR